MLNGRCLWDIPADRSRKQMARSAVWEEARPEQTVPRQSCRAEQQTKPSECTGAQRERSVRYLGRVEKRSQWEKEPREGSKCYWREQRGYMRESCSSSRREGLAGTTF